MNIDELSGAEAKEKLREFYESPYCNAYLAIKSQVDQWSEEIERLDISITHTDSKKVGDWIKIQRKVMDDLIAMREKIDPEALKKAKEKRLKAKAGSPEHYVKYEKAADNGKLPKGETKVAGSVQEGI